MPRILIDNLKSLNLVTRFLPRAKSIRASVQLAALAMSAILASSNALGQLNWTEQFSQALPRVGNNSFGSQLNPNSGFASNVPYSSANGFVSTRSDWKLGVNIQNLDVGALVTDVSPNSAAYRAGINIRDIIVAVGPSRLGIQELRVVELAEEIKKYVDPYGRVNLLILDDRTKQLRSVGVTMQSDASSVSGLVSLRDLQNLPVGSYLSVQLRNLSQTYFEINGGKLIKQVQGAGPFDFQLAIDPLSIPPNDVYELSVGIVYNSQTIYGLSQGIRVNGSSLSQPMNITLERIIGGSINSGGTPVNVAYPGMVYKQDEISRLFLSILNRQPSSAELLGWSSYLQQGNNFAGMKSKLLSSNQFRERFPDDMSYLQNLIFAATDKRPETQEINYWYGRLRNASSTEQVIREMMGVR